MKKKIAALILTLILIVNLILFAMHRISNLIFWAVILGIGIITYFSYKKKN